jgi:cellulose synthase/poly-beta-1,6-N-acetylglucosamine synthase-like glycosyltransferase
MEIGFWVSFLIIIYTWGGYFLLLKLLLCFRKNYLNIQISNPRVTVLLTVFNERKNIDRRLKNLLSQEYEKNRFDILVASDGSTDETNAIVEAYAEQNSRIQLFKAKGGGKSKTQNDAIPFAKGDIILLTDANTIFAPDAMKNMMKHFANEDVGCVSGRLVLKKAEGSVAEGQGLYWRFEMAMRKMESELGVMHTATGCIMAFRKELFRPFKDKYGDDCIIPLDIIQQGYRVIHDDSAIAYDTFPITMLEELNSRIRMTLRNLTGTLSKYTILNPYKYPLISLATTSHKLLRWLTPCFMGTAMIINLILIGAGEFYLLLVIGQGLFYLLGAVGLVGYICGVQIPIATSIFTFLLANTGFFLGVLKAIIGENINSYKKRKPYQGTSL